MNKTVIQQMLVGLGGNEFVLHEGNEWCPLGSSEQLRAVAKFVSLMGCLTVMLGMS